MQYEYECKKCGHEQTKNVKLVDKTTKEPCDKCGATAKNLKRILSAHPKHGSWAPNWQG